MKNTYLLAPRKLPAKWRRVMMVRGGNIPIDLKDLQVEASIDSTSSDMLKYMPCQLNETNAVVK